MDDWQESQLNNRHVHNRVGKGNKRHGGGKSGGVFNVHKTFGTYDIKCPSASKLSAKDDSENSISKLELYTLNESGNSVVGELILGGVFHATVLLAGSRKTMNAVVRGLQVDTNENVEGDSGSTIDGTSNQEEVSRNGNEEEGDQEGEEIDEDDEDEEDEFTENNRAREFEKNSFRSPKFWLKWQGQVNTSAAEVSTPGQMVTDTGYIVFSGNQCDRFQGTISCESLEWNNVKISGWKTKTQSARDFAVTWHAAE